MAVISGTNSIKTGNLGLGHPKCAIGLYEFATHGGTVGPITLSGDQIPSGAIITDSLVITDTVPTSGGAATIAVAVEGAGDIATGAISATPWSTATPKRGAITATSTPVKTTAARSIVATVAVAALTAGKFRVIVTYVDAP